MKPPELFLDVFLPVATVRDQATGQVISPEQTVTMPLFRQGFPGRRPSPRSQKNNKTPNKLITRDTMANTVARPQMTNPGRAP